MRIQEERATGLRRTGEKRGGAGRGGQGRGREGKGRLAGTHRLHRLLQDVGEFGEHLGLGLADLPAEFLLGLLNLLPGSIQPGCSYAASTSTRVNMQI